VFNKWFRDRKKRIVPVEIVGRDEDSKPEVEAEEKKAEGLEKRRSLQYRQLRGRTQHQADDDRKIQLEIFW